MNWNFAYNLVFSVGLLIAAVIKFAVNPVYFSINYFIIGTIGSFFGTAGCLFSQSAIASGAPLGPIGALSNLQMLVLTIISAIATGVMPNWVQWLGLMVGLFSACVITIPEQMLNFVYTVTTCKSKKERKEDFVKA